MRSLNTLVAWLLVASGLFAQAPAPRLVEGDLQETGAFRLPLSGGSDQTTFAYGGTALAFDPWRQSIWLVGHDWYQRIAEISVPVPEASAPASALPRATLKTSWIDTEWRRKVLGGTIKIGGILPQADGSRIVSAYAYYDASGQQVVSHFRIAADGTVTGPFALRTSDSAVAPGRAGSVSGWIVPIPPEWQPALGGAAMTGQCCLSIISRTSFGPALSVFSPDDLGQRTPVPVREVLGYPMARPTIGDCGTAGALFNCSSNMGGAAFIAGTRSVLFFQRVGTGPVVYRSGFSAAPYKTQVLAYDVNDLVAVRNGRRRPWDVVPYATWDLPYGDRIINGVAYDAAGGRIFLSLAYQDGEQPLIRVLRVQPRQLNQAAGSLQ